MTTEASAEVAEALPTLLARRVRGYMAENRMRQGELAVRLGMSRTALNDRLNDVKAFNLAELPALADALGTSIEYLLGLTDDRSPRHAAVAAPGGGSMFLPVDEAGTPSGTRTPNPLINGTEGGAVVMPFRRRPAAAFEHAAGARRASVTQLPERSA